MKDAERIAELEAALRRSELLVEQLQAQLNLGRKKVQAAPAGEREALERELLSVLDFSDSNLRRVVDHLLEVGYSRAAWQRTQAAGVPDGWRLVPVEPTAEMIEALAASFWPADWEAGKRLQRLRGTKVVFPKTEIEMAVGKYERVLAAAPAQPAAQAGQRPELTVWEGAMPESNGKSNFTAVLMRKGAHLFDGISGGMTISRSEYPDRVRYEADCVRWLIGELKEEPCIVDYDAEKHSGYVASTQPAAQEIKP